VAGLGDAAIGIIGAELRKAGLQNQLEAFSRTSS